MTRSSDTHGSPRNDGNQHNGSSHDGGNAGDSLRALLAPTIDTRGNLREIILIPLAAVFMALLIGALIMMATSVEPHTVSYTHLTLPTISRV